MRTASCPSSGCAACAAGYAQSTSRSSARNAADARASGSTAAHMSWVNPSRPVSGPLRSPPPNSSAASRSSTLSPASASRTAPTSPFGPEPTTTASNPSACRTGVPSRAAAAVDDEVQFLPEDVHALEARRAQEADLEVERDHVPDVVLVAELLRRGPVVPLVRGR